MGMKLIREEIEDVQLIEESTQEGKHLVLKGVFLQQEITNRNRRWYPAHIMEREATRYIDTQIKKGTSWGELGHPNTPGINPTLISHIITELKQDGNNWLGKAKVINEGNGKIVRGMIDAGGVVGMSSRGLGSLKEDKQRGCMIVQDDFRLMVGADIVTNPSAPDAFMQGIMEGVEWSFDPKVNAWVQEQVEPLRRNFKQMSTRQIKENQAKVYAKFIRMLAKS